MTRRRLRAHKNLCADVIRNDYDLTKNKFSYRRLKEREAKVPEFLLKQTKSRHTANVKANCDTSVVVGRAWLQRC